MSVLPGRNRLFICRDKKLQDTYFSAGGSLKYMNSESKYFLTEIFVTFLALSWFCTVTFISLI